MNCKWEKEDPEENTYKSECGEIFSFNVGNPVDNQFRYCPFCGKPLYFNISEK